MKHLSKGMFAGVALATVAATGAWAAANFNNVGPKEFDPGHSYLVQAGWLSGIGCPTNAPYAVYPAKKANATYTACATGDTKDKRNEGLLLGEDWPDRQQRFGNRHTEEREGNEAHRARLRHPQARACR